MDPNNIVIGTALYLGMIGAIVLLNGWRLVAAGGILGTLLFPLVLEGPHPPHPKIVQLALGALMGCGIAYVGGLVKENLGPHLRPFIDPDSWETAAVRTPLSLEERRDRVVVANSAAAGASAFGLLSIVGSKVLSLLFSGELHKILSTEKVAVWLLTSGVIAWLGISFLYLITGTDHHDTEEEPSKTATNPSVSNWLRFGIILFTFSVMEQIIEDLLKEGLWAEEGTGIMTLLVNSLTAAVVTYYWVAATQLREPSVAKASAFSCTILGAILTFPFFGFHLLLLVTPGGGNVGGKLIWAMILAVVCSVLFGILIFGLYAFAGGLAIGSGRNMPVAARVMLGLLPVAALYTLITVYGLRQIEPLLDQKDSLVTLNDWLQHIMQALGWGLALLLNKRTERALSIG